MQLALAESTSGATEHVQPPLRRVAENAYSYTEAEFKRYYGSGYRDKWDQAFETVDSQTPATAPAAPSAPVQQGGAPDHSEPRNHVEPAQTPNAAQEHGDPNRADPNPAPELADTRGDAQIIYSMQDARNFRAGWRGQQATFHKEARDALNRLTESAQLGAAEHSLDDYFRWREYVALHEEYESIIDAGIILARAERVQETSDSNRGGQNRTDFVFYRNDNTWCRVHPGKRTKNDAQLRFGTNREDHDTISSMYQLAQIPFMEEAAALIPQTDLFGKTDALAKLQALDPGMLGATEHDAFKWWLFFPTLSPQHRAELFGPGICEVELREKSTTHAVLRIGRSDHSVKHLVLTKLRHRIKTQLHDRAVDP